MAFVRDGGPGSLFCHRLGGVRLDAAWRWPALGRMGWGSAEVRLGKTQPACHVQHRLRWIAFVAAASGGLGFPWPPSVRMPALLHYQATSGCQTSRGEGVVCLRLAASVVAPSVQPLTSIGCSQIGPRPFWLAWAARWMQPRQESARYLGYSKSHSGWPSQGPRQVPMHHCGAPSWRRLLRDPF